MNIEDQINAILTDPTQLREVTKGVFDEVDTDGSGQIDRTELKRALNMIAKDASLKVPSDGDIDGILQALDADGSGALNVQEFEVLIVEVLKALKTVEKPEA